MPRIELELQHQSGHIHVPDIPQDIWNDPTHRPENPSVERL